MADSHVIGALRFKRAELAGQIDALQNQLREAMIAIGHVDCTLRLFAPDIDLDQIRPKPLPTTYQAFRGQVTREILATIREEGAMDAKALALRIMAGRSLDTGDKALVKTMQARVGGVLRNLRARGLIEAEKCGALLLWRLVG